MPSHQAQEHPPSQFIQAPARYADMGLLGKVCRLGLASRGNTHLEADDVFEAVRRGVNYLNWCGQPDEWSRAVRRMGPSRRHVVVAAQLSARSAGATRRELDELKGELGTDYLDVVTYYYVEHPEEWQQITAAAGAAQTLEHARANGEIRMIGLTSHQRKLAADVAAGGHLDLLMIRYNAAHRGAERDVFPVTMPRHMPVVAYTALRWGALMQSTPEDPRGFDPPRAPQWYRFAMCHPAVTVVVMAPDSRTELEENLGLLDHWQGFTNESYLSLRDHGDRVHRHAGRFL